jgi:hypothetical protein
MGYAGYVPAKLGAVKSELAAALGAIPCVETLAFLETVTRNAATQPGEPKFRRLREGNARVASVLASPGGRRALAALGWEADVAASADDPALLLPRGLGTTADLKEIIDAAGEARRAARRRGGAAPPPNPAEAARLAVQMAADRAEVAAGGPVGACKAVALVEGGGGGGAKVVSAGDLGVNRG